MYELLQKPQLKEFPRNEGRDCGQCNRLEKRDRTRSIVLYCNKLVYSHAIYIMHFNFQLKEKQLLEYDCLYNMSKWK